MPYGFGYQGDDVTVVNNSVQPNNWGGNLGSLVLGAGIGSLFGFPLLGLGLGAVLGNNGSRNTNIINIRTGGRGFC